MDGKSGKGDKMRPRLCSRKQYENNWDQIFGKKEPKRKPLPTKGIYGYPAPTEQEEELLEVVENA